MDKCTLIDIKGFGVDGKTIKFNGKSYRIERNRGQIVRYIGALGAKTFPEFGRSLIGEFFKSRVKCRF